MTLPSSRLTYLSGFIIICILLSVSAYLQIYQGITPCPLCILQRMTLAVLGVVFFFGAALTLQKKGRLFFSSLGFLLASIGTSLAGRQVWLQHLPPDQMPDCGASLQYMLQVLPLSEVLQKVLTGSAECSQVDWLFLHMSLAEWSLICFSFLLLLSFIQFCRTLLR